MMQSYSVWLLVVSAIILDVRGLSASMNCYACSSTEIGEYCKEPLKNGVGRAEIQSMSQSCDQYCAWSEVYDPNSGQMLVFRGCDCVDKEGFQCELCYHEYCQPDRYGNMMMATSSRPVAAGMLTVMGLLLATIAGRLV